MPIQGWPPSFTDTAPPEEGQESYIFIEKPRSSGLSVTTGQCQRRYTSSSSTMDRSLLLEEIQTIHVAFLNSIFQQIQEGRAGTCAISSRGVTGCLPFSLLIYFS